MTALVSIFACFTFEAWGASARFPIQISTGVFPVAYERYGKFIDAGSERFKYKLSIRRGLAEAMGAGLYPGQGSDLKADPAYRAWRKSQPGPVNPWNYVNSGDPQSDYYAWVTAEGISPGTRLFFSGQALEAAGHFELALKAYRAVVVHFFREPIWAADHSFVWYPSKEALSRIEAITSHHPEIGYRLEDAEVKIVNGRDTVFRNDAFVVHPGRWERWDPDARVDLRTLDVVERRGEGSVQLRRYENGHWRLFVDEEPYFIRGVTYAPTRVGDALQDGEGNRWMFLDQNKNGRIDGPYDTWIDRDGDNAQGAFERNDGDFEFMQQMGVNTIRLFRYATGDEYDPAEFNKDLLRDLNRRFGIKCIMGEFLGAYTIGSGASWQEGTDYTDRDQTNRMKKIVGDYVLDHKDQPYVLMWLLGNENLMPADFSGVNATRTNASEQVEAYLTFVNDVAEMIHSLDPNHPVAVGNFGLANLEEHAAYAPAVDVFGVNAYRGRGGFGDLWKLVKRHFDRPVLIAEFGADAYDSRSDREDQDAQADYHEGNWRDILLNASGRAGRGNAIGGVIFEYLDEWWKSQSDSWSKHSTARDFPMAFPDGWASEEWFGLMSQGDGSKSPFLRRPRKAYRLYKEKLWRYSYEP